MGTADRYGRAGAQYSGGNRLLQDTGQGLHAAFDPQHPVGGVCAFAIENPKVKIYCDDSMKRFETVFPACGSDNSAIELTCEELYQYSKAIGWIDVCKLPEVQA